MTETRQLTPYDELMKKFTIWTKKFRKDAEDFLIKTEEDTLPYVYNLCKNNPEYFFKKYIKIISPNFAGRDCSRWVEQSRQCNLELFDYQEELLRSCINDSKVLCICGRQMGKTTVLEAFVLWFALFHPNTNVGIISRNSKQAKKTLNEVKTMFNKLPSFLKLKTDIDSSEMVEFLHPLQEGEAEPSKSRIIVESLSPDAFSGWTMSLILADEMELWNRKEKGMDEKVMSAIIPTGARILAISSLKDSDSWFRREFQNEMSSWKNFYFNYMDHPFYGTDKEYTIMDARSGEYINRTWKEYREAEIGVEKFDLEHACALRGAGDDNIFIELTDDHICSSDIIIQGDERIFIAMDHGFSKTSQTSIIFGIVRPNGPMSVVHFFQHFEFIPKTVRDISSKVFETMNKFRILPTQVEIAVDGNDIKVKATKDSATNIVKDLEDLFLEEYKMPIKIKYTRKYSQEESIELVNVGIERGQIKIASTWVRKCLTKICRNKQGKIPDNMYTNVVDSVRIWMMNYHSKIRIKRSNASSSDEGNVSDSLLGSGNSIKYTGGGLYI